MPLERRQRLLEWSARTDAMIVEDDYDSEFRFGGRPLEPLKSIDRDGRVLYIGSFAKSMFAQLRIGYAVLPEGWTHPFGCAKRLFEPYPTGWLEQRALADFLRTGAYDRHLRRMTRLYRRRYEALRTALSMRLSDVFEITSFEAGMHLFARWKRDAASWSRFKQACVRLNVSFRDAADHYLKPEISTPGACLGFAHLSEKEIGEAAARMEMALASISDEPVASIGKGEKKNAQSAAGKL